MGARETFLSWPVLRQLTGTDRLGRGPAVKSALTEELAARTSTADRVARSVCPYCAVGCDTMIYVKDGVILDIEGDPNSPINQGTLCPKGSASFQLITHSGRLDRVRYRAPRGAEWTEIGIGEAMDRIADRVWESRRRTWVEEVDGEPVRHTTGIAHLGGATLDNEENYLIKKLFTGGLGMVAVSNQARI